MIKRVVIEVADVFDSRRLSYGIVNKPFLIFIHLFLDYLCGT